MGDRSSKYSSLNDSKELEITNYDRKDNIPVERIYTIRVNLSGDVALILMRNMYTRLDISIDDIKILVHGLDYTIFLVKSERIKSKLMRELYRSYIKYM